MPFIKTAGRADTGSIWFTRKSSSGTTGTLWHVGHPVLTKLSSKGCNLCESHTHPHAVVTSVFRDPPALSESSVDGSPCLP